MDITLQDITISILRWFIGLSVGSCLGIAFGLLVYYIRNLGGVLTPVFHFARALPILGLVPVIQYAFGVNEIGKIGLISWAVMFPVWLSVEIAIKRQFPELELMLRSLDVPKREYFLRYTLPKLYGGILQGVQIGIGIAWLSVVASEFIGTYSTGFWSGGLGYKLFLAFDLNDWEIGLAALGCFGLLGIVSSALWQNVFCQRIIVARGFNPLIWISRS